MFSADDVTLFGRDTGDEQVIADAAPPSLGGLEQPGDLGLVQVVLGTLVGVRARSRSLLTFRRPGAGLGSSEPRGSFVASPCLF
jgi:hypothetical protein